MLRQCIYKSSKFNWCWKIWIAFKLDSRSWLKKKKRWYYIFFAVQCFLQIALRCIRKYLDACIFTQLLQTVVYWNFSNAAQRSSGPGDIDVVSTSRRKVIQYHPSRESTIIAHCPWMLDTRFAFQRWMVAQWYDKSTEPRNISQIVAWSRA